jgi:hypothetical protein
LFTGGGILNTFSSAVAVLIPALRLGYMIGLSPFKMCPNDFIIELGNTVVLVF